MRRVVILGINYHFNLEWDLAGNMTEVHRFLVTRDRGDMLSVLMHTSHERSRTPTGPEADSAAAGDSASVRLAQYNADGEWALLQDVTTDETGAETGVSATEQPPALSAAELVLLTHEHGPRGRIAHLQGHAMTAEEAETYASEQLLSEMDIIGNNQHDEHIQKLDAAGGTAYCSDSEDSAAAAGLPHHLRPHTAASLAAAAQRPLRIVSYNIWNINGHDQVWGRIDCMQSAPKVQNLQYVLAAPAGHIPDPPGQTHVADPRS